MSPMTEVLERLAEMPRRLRTVAGELVTQECIRPHPMEFSLVEHACHLRDLEEEAYLVRIRRILREDHPKLADFDGAATAVERNYLAQDVATALSDFEVARRRNIKMLDGLDRSALERTGQLTGKGVITLRRLAELMLEHDTGHATEMASLLTAARRGWAAPTPTP